MSLKLAKIQILVYGFIMCLLSSCFHPPYNNFKPDPRAARKSAKTAVVGSVVGALAGGTMTATGIGAAVGGTVGLINGIYNDSKPQIIKQLKKQSIQYVEYGDTMTLIIPTDKYFLFMSPRLNELCYPGLLNVVRLLKMYPQSPIYVAGFTDNVGSSQHKKHLSQAQAETMLTYLWANDIRAMRLKAEGYGDKNDIAPNEFIHGSAMNRRIEIQWFTGLIARAQAPVFYTK